MSPHTMSYYSTVRKHIIEKGGRGGKKTYYHEIFCNVDGVGACHVECISQKEKDRYRMIPHKQNRMKYNKRITTY